MDYANFEDLAREHQAFLAFLARAEESPPPFGCWERLFFLLDKVHHEKEERFLFPLLFTGSAEPSGPKCATFFPPRWMNSCAWQDPYHTLSAALSEETGVDTRSPFRQRVFSSQSMLRIPIEDHLLGERAVAAMRIAPTRAPEILPKLAAMLRDHIRREDECLFELLRAKLSGEQKETYAREAAEFDRRAGTEALLAEISAPLPP